MQLSLKKVLSLRNRQDKRYFIKINRIPFKSNIAQSFLGSLPQLSWLRVALEQDAEEAATAKQKNSIYVQVNW